MYAFLRRFIGADRFAAGLAATPAAVADRRRYEANHAARSARLLDLACTVDRKAWAEAVGPLLDALDAALAAESDRRLVNMWGERYRFAARTVITRAALVGLGIDTSAVPVGILERLVTVTARPAAEVPA